MVSERKERVLTEVVYQYYLPGRTVIEVPSRFEPGDSGVQIFDCGTIPLQ
jgi:hypothetical protein